MRKNQVYKMTHSLADVVEGQLLVVLKGGKEPNLAYLNEEKMPVFITVSGKMAETPSVCMERSQKKESDPLLKEYRISYNKEFETDRGIAFDTVISIGNKKVVELTNRGDGGMSTVKNLTENDEVKELVNRIKKVYVDAGENFQEDGFNENFIEDFIFYEIDSLRPIMSFKEYLKYNQKQLAEIAM